MARRAILVLLICSSLLLFPVRTPCGMAKSYCLMQSLSGKTMSYYQVEPLGIMLYETEAQRDLGMYYLAYVAYTD